MKCVWEAILFLLLHYENHKSISACMYAESRRNEKNL